MKYNNETVRRRDRLMDETRALELLRTSEYGVLSMVADGGGYGIPINFVWDGKDSIYIHCAQKVANCVHSKSTRRFRSASWAMCTCYRVSSLPSTKVLSSLERHICISPRKNA